MAARSGPPEGGSYRDQTTAQKYNRERPPRLQRVVNLSGVVLRRVGRTPHGAVEIGRAAVAGTVGAPETGDATAPLEELIEAGSRQGE